jgi:transposase InsO family protein
MDIDNQINTGQVLLKSRSDWPYWYAQLELHARDKAVWDQVNPEDETVLPIDDQEPLYPELPPEPEIVQPLSSTATTEQRAQQEDAIIQYEHKLAVRKSAIATHQEDVRKYKVATSRWTRTVAKLSNLRDWINKTVSHDLMAPAAIKMLNRKQFTPQELIRILKNDLAPTDSVTMHLVRQQYRAHLEKARNGRITPDKWFNDWQVLYGKAQAFKVIEVEGQLAMTDFLDALSVRIAPEWARSMRQDIIKDAALNRPMLSMDDLAKIFTLTLQERAIDTQKGRSTSVYATFGGSGSTNEKTLGRTKNKCPCKKDGIHPWQPIECRRLQTAVTGSSPEGSIPIKLLEIDKKKITARLNSKEWSTLRNTINQSGWETAPVNKLGSTGTKYPGTLTAALIDPTEFTNESAQGVYSTSYPAHPLSKCTILDGGGAIHLVNDRDLLVPGTFKKSESIDTVEAGTQSLPVSGYGDRLLKGILNGTKGPRTEDLLLNNVKVVEGFHVNIVSEARLKKVGIWYLGLDSTLRYGSFKDHVVLTHLHCAHNLTFIEYNKVGRYSNAPALVNAVKRSWKAQTRSDVEHLWHKRSGHLGQRALQALVKAAQNVQIEGTKRSHCAECATTHASQVISRRPRERSPRPFYRISWDLFDMPTGRLNEEWSLIIKDDYSGKLYNQNLQSKTLSEIMRVIEAFVAWIERKYQLLIVQIHQDNDTATLPWRGRSRYEEWAEYKGIKILHPPPYTHQPNGSAERAGQELITKSIKMRLGANLPAKLWPLIMDAAAYLHSISPLPIHQYRSPNEVLESWFRQYFRWYEPVLIRHRTADLRPDWSGIYAYGCRAYPLNRDRAAGRDKRGFKVNPRAHIGYLVGYRASNIYHIWVPTLDQVITSRDVTFDESLFYEGNPETEMPKEQAIKLVEILHNGELTDPGQDIDIPVLEDQEAAAQNTLEQATEQDLGGEQDDELIIEVGQPNDQQVDQADTTRVANTASEQLRIRAGLNKKTGLATPEMTPEPAPLGRSDQSNRRGTDSDQALQRPGRDHSSNTRDRSRSHGLRQERPINPTSRPVGLDSDTTDEVGSQTQIPPTRSSRRQRGVAPEINRYPGVYMPLRNRKKKDPDDQMGGGGKPGGVHALIADLKEDQWSDFHQTLIPGVVYDWDDRASYKTLNSVVMSAMLKVPVALKITDRKHRDDLQDPPTSWKQLLQHQMGQLFKEAAIKEIEQLRKKGTWTEIPRSQSIDRPLPLKWVWTYKYDQDGYFLKCKARIVVRGDLQEKDTLNSTYAATLAAKSFRTAMAIAAQFDLEIMQYDVVGAFLNAMITSENPVICEMPDGFKKDGICAKLNRALYGLRDSPLLWYEEFSRTLRSRNLTSAKEEPCLFFDQDRKILILFYVDDILLIYHKDYEQETHKIWDKVKEKYEIQDQGPVEWFLGVRVIRNRQDRTITLVHDTYIDKITKKFDLGDGSFPPTPLPSEELIKNTGEATKQRIKSYQERVGSVLYTAIMLRPDIAFAVSKLSHFLTNPSDQHFKAVERVIMYLYRTRWEAIQYGNYNGPDLTICGDASFADDPETRRSSHGYIAMLFGGAILWKAARQNTITTSTTEAELLALEHVTKEAMALKRFFKELTIDLGELWTVWCDNQQTIRLVVGKNERITTRLRHVDIQNMWLRQEHAKGSFQVEYLETSIMPADGLTKSLTHQQFERFKLLLNLKDSSKTITGIEKKRSFLLTKR